LSGALCSALLAFATIAQFRALWGRPSPSAYIGSGAGRTTALTLLTSSRTRGTGTRGSPPFLVASPQPSRACWARWRAAFADPGSTLRTASGRLRHRPGDPLCPLVADPALVWPPDRAWTRAGDPFLQTSYGPARTGDRPPTWSRPEELIPAKRAVVDCEAAGAISARASQGSNGGLGVRP